jgi:ABC-type nitrate/sulfonate/bicarbonate transport system permease component
MAELAVTAPAQRRHPRLLGDVAWIRLITAAVLLCGYESVARSGWLFDGVVPPLGAILGALIRITIDPTLYPNLAVTIWEVFAGFAIGSAAGLAVGIAFGVWSFAGRIFEPWIHYLAPTPKIIFLPILVLLFGVETGSKMAMGAISCFFPVAVAVCSGMRQVRPVFLRVMRSLDASTWQTIRMVYLPSLVAPALAGMRIGLGAAIIGTLLAEMKLSRAGLGHLIIQAYNFFKVADMYALLILVFALAWAANAGMEAIARRLAR